MSDENTLSRRTLMKLGLLLNGLVAIAIATPIVGYLLSPVKRKGAYRSWVSLGPIEGFPESQTRLVDFENPSTNPWDGKTSKAACWVRHEQGEKFQVFAINCAHLGCPVRWFPQSGLFMCPCHGGVYYADGSRASGPPERGLFEYAYKVDGGELHIDAGLMPTLAKEGLLGKGKSPCAG